MSPLEPAAARLFPHYQREAIAADEAQPFVLARLLEDGSSTDLRTLLRSVGEARLRDWLAARGGRALSRRSRAFWAWVLGAEAPQAPALASELWPLA